VSLDLRSRDTVVQELMDDAGCDASALHRTYARFAAVNRLVSGWHRTYRTQIRPLLSADRPTTLLDIGFGGGDLPRALRRWAVRDGLELTVDAIDPDPRALAFVSTRPATPGVRFRQAGSAELAEAGERYDLVTSNHLLHHLDAAGLQQLLADSERLARRLVLHSDLRRSRTAYLAWAAASWPTARDSFLFTDGLLSIRRSYRPAELAAAAPPGWRVRPQPPFRLLLTRSDPEGSRG
jgi:2-polyprenyl-3-methyl-5-hydroxy-6-metoxy-1,4-benzoquinol methylase